MSLESFERFPLLFGPSPIQALPRLTKHGEIAQSSNVLYAHLGGQPALNAYASLFS